MEPQSNRTSLLLDLPEQGVLELPLAGLGRRILATLIDAALMLGVGLLVVVVTLVAGSSPVTGAMLYATAALLPVIGPCVFEIAWGGQTPGKRLFSLRVISREGGQAVWWQLLLRNGLRLVDFLPVGYFLGLGCAFATKLSQRLGDLVGGTVVIREDPQALLDRALWAPHAEPSAPARETAVSDLVLRAAGMLTDPRRHIDAVALARWQSEIAALVRRQHPELLQVSDAEIWNDLQRQLESRR